MYTGTINFLCACVILSINIFLISLANDFILTIVIWPLLGYNIQAQISIKSKYWEHLTDETAV